jgi:hypothetical protein
MENKIIIIFESKFLLVYLFNKLFFKQYYVKNKVYTLFLTYHLLYKFGFFNKIYKIYYI